MVSFFPTPYPDELLYSVLARYHVRSANVSPKATLRELFGATTVIATFDLPSHIENLVSNLPMLSTHTVDGFIERHTLYPLYAPFLPPERALLVADSMRSHFYGDIHTRTGIMASSVPVYSSFRFCPVCLNEEVQKYGEPYWHRLHQVTGVLVCPAHYVLLQKSTVKIRGENRHEFYVADVENCSFKPAALCYSNETFNKLILLAQDVDAVLNQPIKSKTGEWYRRQYQALLTDKGLTAATGRVYQKTLLREFTDFYGNEFLEAVHSKIESGTEGGWLADIVRKHRKVFHPIRHLLLMRFLDRNVNSFFACDYVSKPFGEGPWTCFNAASGHYLGKKINSVSVSYSRDSKRLIGTFSCSCGFAYSTSESSVPNGNKLKFGKIRSFGVIWEQKLKELLIIEKSSFREAARRLKVDTKTVIRYAKRLRLISLGNQENLEESGDSAADLTEKLETNRKIWSELQLSNLSFGKTDLRGKLPHIYMWLYRHDRKWLSDNSPRKRVPVYANSRVNWTERDEQILIAARKAVKELLEKTPPVRITVGAVGKTLSISALLEKHLSRLPETSSFMALQTETVEEFQIRRVIRAARELAERGETVKAWKIMRIAGIKENCSESVTQTVNKEVPFAESYFYTCGKTGS
jgi:hypothetical protein